MTPKLLVEKVLDVDRCHRSESGTGRGGGLLNAARLQGDGPDADCGWSLLDAYWILGDPRQVAR